MYVRRDVDLILAITYMHVVGLTLGMTQVLSL